MSPSRFGRVVTFYSFAQALVDVGRLLDERARLITEHSSSDAFDVLLVAPENRVQFADQLAAELVKQRPFLATPPTLALEDNQSIEELERRIDESVTKSRNVVVLWEPEAEERHTAAFERLLFLHRQEPTRRFVTVLLPGVAWHELPEELRAWHTIESDAGRDHKDLAIRLAPYLRLPSLQ